MERIVHTTITLAAVLFSLQMVPHASAEVLLVPSDPAGDAGSEGFPVSRFGDAPANSMRGFQADWPAQVQYGNRAPAGMVFDDEQGQAAAPTTAGGSGTSDDAALKRRAASRDALRQEVRRTSPQDTASAGAIRDGSSSTEGTRRVFRDQPVPKSPSSAQPMDLIPDRTKGVQEISVIAGDLGFFPKTFFVSRDVPVRLFVTGASKKPLCIMMDSFQVRRQVSAQKIEEITFTPNVPGQYRFYCPMNGMEGTMVVKELASVGE